MRPQVTCYRCGDMGPVARECPRKGCGQSNRRAPSEADFTRNMTASVGLLKSHPKRTDETASMEALNEAIEQVMATMSGDLSLGTS